MDVNATDDWTVDGTTHTNSRAAISEVGITVGASGVSARPSSGNTANVMATISRWTFHTLRPFHTSDVDSRAPYRKNSATMPACMRTLTTSIAVPWAGSTMPRPARASISRTNGSMRTGPP